MEYVGKISPPTHQVDCSVKGSVASPMENLCPSTVQMETPHFSSISEPASPWMPHVPLSSSLHQCCQMAKFDPFLSLDCAPMPSTLAQSKVRKESNFAIW